GGAQRSETPVRADDGRIHPLGARIQQGVRDLARASGSRQAGHSDPATGADESRSRDRLRRRRRPPKRDSGSGDEWGRGENGGSVPARRWKARARRGSEGRYRPRTGPGRTRMRPILLRGGTLVDPSQRLNEVGDLLITDGQIREFGRKISAPDEAE